MPSPDAFIPDDPELATSNVVSAVIETAPVGLGDELRVTLPSFDPLQAFEISFWMPRGTDIPSVGDQGLVAFDENGEPWLIGWQPTSS